MPYEAEVVLEGFLALDTPEGFRAELIEGEIVVKSTPDGNHEHCLSRVLGQVILQSSTDMQVSENKGLKLASAGCWPQDHVIPDMTLVPREGRPFRGAAPWMPCDGVIMVGEVTSTRPEADREVKRRCYARGGIPFYLLIDRDASSVTLFRDPEKGDYRRHCTVSFGKPLALPEPFAFDLDTTDFL
ncbi:Uma2 family endonuclease [Streptomyces albicerus]|uniref:Uma2 family endonuclease n=1 Tax=Streptomyces albicerus TaxID=2569859 RepID=UPI00124BC824|nr:Uma2 family endonuclease [Streptomyces albicerus]